MSILAILPASVERAGRIVISLIGRIVPGFAAAGEGQRGDVARAGAICWPGRKTNSYPISGIWQRHEQTPSDPAGRADRGGGITRICRDGEKTRPAPPPPPPPPAP